MTIRPDRRQAHIEEFRQSGGNIGGNFAGEPVLLLTTTGSKSGQSRTVPLRYLPDGERFLVIASYGGSPQHPAWYHNLKANPAVVLEVGREKFSARAVVLTGQERDRLYARAAAKYSIFADYEKRTSRKIPVVALQRIG